MANNKRRNVPNGLWYKCEICNELKFSRELARNLMVCSKCGYHFLIKATNLLKGIFDEDEFVRIRSRSNFATIGRLLLDDYQAIAIAIDNPQIDQNSIHKSECLAFIDAIELSIKERVPFISIYDTLKTSGFSIQSQKIALLADAVNRLSKMQIPHITVLVNTTPESDFITYFPMGDIVIADSPKPRLRENSAETKANRNGIPTNELDSNELLIDMRIDRRKIADILEKLVIFFMHDA